MKQLLSIAAMFLLFLVGCSKDVNINSPIDNQTNGEFITRDFSEDSMSKQSSSTSSKTSTSSYTVSKEIDGSKGGLIFYGDFTQAQGGNKAQVYASCFFPAGSFSGKKTITMTLDTKACTGTFSPSMVFDKPVSFTALFTGVDLKNYNPSTLKFVYYDVSGAKYEISSSYLYIDKDKGVLGILNAQLPHFSRYGFIR